MLDEITHEFLVLTVILETVTFLILMAHVGVFQKSKDRPLVLMSGFIATIALGLLWWFWFYVLSVNEEIFLKASIYSFSIVAIGTLIAGLLNMKPKTIGK